MSKKKPAARRTLHPRARTAFPKENFIWHPDESMYFEPVQNSFVCFRKSFEVKDPAHAELDIFAHNAYALWINGEYIARGPCRSDPSWQYVDNINVRSRLNKGINTIAILVLYYGYGTGQTVDRMRGLWAKLRITESDKKKQRVETNESWKCAFADWFDRSAARVNGRQGPIEIIDAQALVHGWQQTDFDDSAWVNAEPMGIPTDCWNLVPREIPMLREECVRASRITHMGTVPASANPSVHLAVIEETRSDAMNLKEAHSPVAGYTVDPACDGKASVVNIAWDRVECGYLQIEADGPAGTVIDAVYAEEIDQGRFLIDPSNRPMDRFILTQGRNSFEIAFGWKAFRYVQLIVRNPDGPVRLLSAGIRTRGYPVDIQGTFASGDPRITRVREICEHTLTLCMQDGFLDSSSREQQQWMGDGRWQAVMNYYISGDSRLHKKMLEQLGQSQNWLGLIRARYPDGHLNFPTITTFNLAWISSFGDYYLYSGDDSLFEAWLPHITNMLWWFTGYENSDGLLENLPYWAFVDWGGLSFNPAESEGMITPVNLLYCESLNTAAFIAAHTGNEELAEGWFERAVNLADAIETHLWDTKRKAYCDTKKKNRFSPTLSEITNAMALILLHNGQDKRAGEIFQTIYSPKREDGILTGSPYGFTLVCRALGRCGHPERALDFIRERYGRMLDQGSTTTWEGWELIHRDKQGTAYGLSSASHGWGGGPLLFLSEEIAGIRPLEPGFTVFSVEPRLCGIGPVECTVPTPQGIIHLNARERNSKTAVEINVPEDSTAVLADGSELKPGSHRLELTE